MRLCTRGLIIAILGLFTSMGSTLPVNAAGAQLLSVPLAQARPVLCAPAQAVLFAAHQVHVVDSRRLDLPEEPSERKLFRPWMMGVSVIAFGILVFLLLRWRTERLQERNEMLETLINSRTLELELARKALEESSLLDELTGLRNRKYLELAIPDEVARVRRTFKEILERGKDPLLEKEDLVFCVMEIDPFPQEVSAVMTPEMMDIVRIQVAEALRSVTRAYDNLLRWGDNSFLLVVKSSQRVHASTIAQGLLDTVRARQFETAEGICFHATCSMGLAPYPMHPYHPRLGSWRQVVGVADQCLHAARRQGCNCWIMAAARPSAPIEPFGSLDAWDVQWSLEHGLMDIKTSETHIKWS